MTLPGSIRRTEPVPGYPVLDVVHPAATARVALHGAQIMEWTPAGQEPVLYLSPQAVYREGKAIRGGVPICWPWFGPHETDRSLPAHGFARNRFWTLSDAGEDEAGVLLRFTLADDDESRRLWPHAFRLEMTMNVGAELRLALRMVNMGDAAFTITGALHTYLAVGDIRRVTIEGLDGAEYLDMVGTKEVRRQDGNIVFDQEVDRDYRSAAEVRVKDAALGRVLTVLGEGSHCTVVWNPWIDKAAALSDVPDADYQRFVCVETANAWEDRITLKRGEAHTLAATVWVCR